MPSKSRLDACCLTILIYISFIMFKGAMRPHHTYVPRLYSKVYNYLDTVGRGYKPRQRGWGGAATLQNVNLFLDFTIK